jgi:deoxyribodipyrimidine photolyase-related protein
MNAASLVFPHQLFAAHPALDLHRPVYLVEEPLFFLQYPFHQQKILLHRASMKAFAHGLQLKGFTLHYIEARDPEAPVAALVEALAEKGVRELHLCRPTDYLLERRTDRAARRTGVALHWYDGPDFLTPREWALEWGRDREHFHQTDFYILQRKRLGLLLDERQKPVGGKWTYDTENRKKPEKNYRPPRLPELREDHWIEEARAYVGRFFSDRPGSLPDRAHPIYWAWTREQSLELLDRFISERLAQFGDYEDAMLRGEHFICHSVLSPMINIGLLTPAEVIGAVMAHPLGRSLPINSVEGFIRQVVGWREFIAVVYQCAGTRQRTAHFWGFRRKIPAGFYTGDTGIGPVDEVVRKVLDTGYAHHIERLMVLGNFFLLCEFDPDAVYQWFMELFIDAYDWVMVPNVYGMTQFADGGLMVTKPYLSGSNYILKMSDHPKGVPQPGRPAWNEIWDGLFWRFLDKHRSFFLQNPRLGMLVGTFDKMDPQKKNRLLETANQFLHQIDRENEKTLPPH